MYVTPSSGLVIENSPWLLIVPGEPFQLDVAVDDVVCAGRCNIDDVPRAGEHKQAARVIDGAADVERAQS